MVNDFQYGKLINMFKRLDDGMYDSLDDRAGAVLKALDLTRSFSSRGSFPKSHRAEGNNFVD